MADTNNIDKLISDLTNILSRGNYNVNKVIGEIVDKLKQSSLQNLKDIDGMLLDSETKLKEIIEREIKHREEINNLIGNIDKLNKEEEAIRRESLNQNRKVAQEAIKERLEEINELREQKEFEIKIQKLINDGKVEEANELVAARDALKLVHDALKEEQEKHVKELKSLNEKIKDEYENVGYKLWGNIVDKVSDATNKVVSVYEENATKLSVALNSTVQDISNLQSKIASDLHSEGLSRAISNVQVLSEAASLTAAGYTNVENIQQSATDIVVGKQLAPNLDFSNTTVKNLTNVFGSDFTTRFAAIQAATQETAGSVVSMQATISSMMTNLEPVFTNAELQNAALQGASDVSATLSAAREQNIITESQQNEYLSMITELMDPSKAFTSSNTAVKVAAKEFYSGGQLTPDAALSALLNATKGMYSNVGQSMSTEDVVSRSLFASAMGMNSLQAAYMPSGYTNVEMQSTEDLGTTSEEQMSKLRSGLYTTTATQEQNIAENAAITQTIGNFAKTFPTLYKTGNSLLITTVSTLPKRIALEMKAAGIGGSLLSGGSGGTTGSLLTDIYSDSSYAASLSSKNPLVKTGILSSELSSPTAGKIKGAQFGSLGNTLMGLWGLTSAANITSDLFNSEYSGLEKISSGGNIASSMFNWAGIGAGAGTLIGGPLGAAIGGVIGAAGGLTTALLAKHEQDEKQTEAIENQTKALNSTFGEGVSLLSSFESKMLEAEGGGTVSLAGGKTAQIDESYYANLPSYATGLDYVPYDNYVASLHKGEAVVTANAANALRKSNPNFWTSTNNNDDVVNALERQTQSIVDAVINGDDVIQPLAQNTGPKQYIITNAYA